MGSDPARRRHQLVSVTAFGIAGGFLLAGFILSLMIGPWELSLADVVTIISAHMAGHGGGPDPADAIVWHGRLPRAITGVFAGFALGAAGTIMQGVFKNPLAEPGIIGTSSGAALGAVTAIYLGLAARTIYVIPLFAIVFAFGALVVVLLVATTGGLTSRYTLLLGGIAFNAMFAALTSVVIVLSTEQSEMARTVVGWLMGDLNNRSWDHVNIILATVLLGVLGAFLYARDLNILMISEELALNFGVNVVWVRNALLFFAALLTGGAIAVAGGIGFVGLIAPHVMRGFVGSDNRLLIPAAGILGGIIVIFSDCLVRIWGHGGIRIGVLTALLGGPFFLFLVIRDRKKYIFF
jgi:iron complex transport system permease protein